MSAKTAIDISNIHTQIIGSFILNLLLAIIVMFALMRRTGVTYPVTVNDVYGMIVAGFLVGFSGIEIVKKILNIT